MRPSLEADGFEVIESVLAPDEITELIAYAELTLPPAGKRGGMRNLLGDDRTRAMVKSTSRTVNSLLGSNGRNVSRWAASEENSGTYSGKSASDW